MCLLIRAKNNRTALAELSNSYLDHRKITGRLNFRPVFSQSRLCMIELKVENVKIDLLLT